MFAHPARSRRTPTTDTNSLRLTEVVASDAFAGTERYVVDVSVELAGRGHDVHVVGGAPGVMPDLLGPAVRWSPGATAPAAMSALVRGGRRDVVHGHLTHGEFAAFAAAPVTLGRRLATRHVLHPRGHGRVGRAVGRLVRAELWAEVAVSEFVAASVRPRSDAVLLNGTRAVSTTSAPVQATEGPGVVLVAQRLEREKATDVVVRAFAASGLAARGWRLAVAGQGPEAGPLRALADGLGVGAAVDLLGWVADVPALMRSSAVFVAPAPREPCGLSVLEAMAHGLPVLASDAGGHRETVGTVPGARTFGAGDVEACAVALRELGADAEGRAAYGAALRERQSGSFSIGAHVDGLERLYRSAVSSRRLRSRR